MTGNGATNVVEVVGRYQKWYSGKLIDKRNAQEFPYFHSFTGCDTSSSFFIMVNVSFGTHNESGEELTEVFIELSIMSSEIKRVSFQAGWLCKESSLTRSDRIGIEAC